MVKTKLSLVKKTGNYQGNYDPGNKLSEFLNRCREAYNLGNALSVDDKYGIIAILIETADLISNGWNDAKFDEIKQNIQILEQSPDKAKIGQMLTDLSYFEPADPTDSRGQFIPLRLVHP